MKTIIFIDTDDKEKIKEFSNSWKNNGVSIMPMGAVRIFIISDEGVVNKLE